MSRGPDRRRWIAAAGAGLAGLWVAACDKLNADPKVAGTLRRAEGLTKKAQRLVTESGTHGDTVVTFSFPVAWNVAFDTATSTTPRV